MMDAGTTQTNLHLPVGRLPISEDWLDRTKLALDRTIPTTPPSGKNISVNMLFKITTGYTNPDTRQIQKQTWQQSWPFHWMQLNL